MNFIKVKAESAIVTLDGPPRSHPVTRKPPPFKVTFVVFFESGKRSPPEETASTQIPRFGFEFLFPQNGSAECLRTQYGILSAAIKSESENDAFEYREKGLTFVSIHQHV